MPGFNTGYKNHELSDAIERVPYVPGRLGELGIFDSRGVARTHVDIEYRHRKLSLLTTRERGSRDATFISGDKRSVYPFRIPHIPQESVIRPDDLPDVRAFGTKDGRVSMAQIVADRLEDMRNNFEATFEWHRIGAVHGHIVEPDGSTIHNLFDIFNISEVVVELNLTQNNEVKLKMAQVVRHIQDVLGNANFRRLHILCGDALFDALSVLDETKDAFNRWRDGAFLRDAQVRSGFEYPNGVFWENYRGSVGDVHFIDTNEARVVPVGVSQLFIRRNGPDTTMAGVGRIGREITVTEERLPHDEGLELKAQANPLFLCTIPSVLVRLVMTPGPSSS